MIETEYILNNALEEAMEKLAQPALSVDTCVNAQRIAISTPLIRIAVDAIPDGGLKREHVVKV